MGFFGPSGIIQAGTSFPPSPLTNDRYFRTDRGVDYYFDGTRWLSVNLLEASLGTVGGIAVTTTSFWPVPYEGLYDLWLDSWTTAMFTSGVGEWDVLLQEVNSAVSVTTIDTQDGSTDTNGVFYGRTRALGVQVASTSRSLRVSFTEISGTATFTGAASVFCRLVG
jgi:hypothetical protein